MPSVIDRPPAGEARPAIEVRDKSPAEKRLALAANEVTIMALLIALVAVSQAFPFKSVKFALIVVFAIIMLVQTAKRPAMGLALLVFATPAIDVVQINLAPAVNTETLIGLYMLLIWFRANQLQGKDVVYSPMSRRLGLYTVVMLLACLNAWLTWHTSLIDTISAAKNHLIYMIALPVAFHTLRDRRDQMLIIIAASLALFFSFMQGINHSWLAFLTGSLERRRAQALLALQPNAFGAAIAMYLPIFMMLALYHVGSRLTRLWFIVLSVTGGFTLLLTLSRGSWMGAIAGLALCALFRARKLLVVMALAGATYQLWIPQQMIDRAESTVVDDGGDGELEGSAKMRVEQYKSLPAMMAPKPVFGWGYKSFPQVFERYGTLKRNKGAHSAYCQYGTEEGVIGLGLLGFTLFSILWTGYRAAVHTVEPLHRWMGVGIMGGILAMAISMITGARWDPQKMFVFFWCFVAVAERETLLALARVPRHAGDRLPQDG